MDTVVLPANRIERASRVMATRYRVAWMVMLATAVVLLAAGVMSQFVGGHVYANSVSDSIEMFILLGILPLAFVFLIRRRAKRMAWIGAQAAADATILWLIEDYRILATDEFGTPRPELAFKITPMLRDELLGVASAALR
jgi:peptidoglycan/LPS O-acetylase OafA/YrhL